MRRLWQAETVASGATGLNIWIGVCATNVCVRDVYGKRKNRSEPRSEDEEDEEEDDQLVV